MNFPEVLQSLQPQNHDPNVHRDAMLRWKLVPNVVRIKLSTAFTAQVVQSLPLWNFVRIEKMLRGYYQTKFWINYTAAKIQKPINLRLNEHMATTLRLFNLFFSRINRRISTCRGRNNNKQSQLWIGISLTHFSFLWFSVVFVFMQ